MQSGFVLTEVDEVEVEEFDTPVLELLLADGHDILLGVESVPQLYDTKSNVSFTESKTKQNLHTLEVM